MMKKTFPFVLLSTILSLALITGCTPRQAADNTSGGTVTPGTTPSDTVKDEIVAHVDNQAITAKEYEAYSNNLIHQMYQGKRDNNDNAYQVITSTLKKSALEKLILNYLIAAEIKKNNIILTPEEVQLALSSTHSSPVASDNKLNNFIEEQVKQSLYEYKFVSTVLKPNVDVSDAEARKIYDIRTKGIKLASQPPVSSFSFSINETQMKEKLKAGNPKLSAAELDKQYRDIVNQRVQVANTIYNEIKAAPQNARQIIQTHAKDLTAGVSGSPLDKNPKPLDSAAYGFMSKKNTAYLKTVESQPTPATSLGVTKTANTITIRYIRPITADSFESMKASLKTQLKSQKYAAALNQWAKEQMKNGRVKVSSSVPNAAELFTENTTAPQVEKGKTSN